MRIERQNINIEKRNIEHFSCSLLLNIGTAHVLTVMNTFNFSVTDQINNQTEIFITEASFRNIPYRVCQ